MSDVRDSIARLVRHVMRDVVFLRRYPSTVTTQHDDGTVDVEPDDAVVRGQGLQRVPIRTGVAGASARVDAGARCVLAFDDGDPAKPCIVEWQYAKGDAVVSLDGGGSSVARRGDLIDVLVQSPTPIAGIATGTVTIPGAPPTIVPVPPTPFVGTATLALPVIAQPIGGAPKVLA